MTSQPRHLPELRGRIRREVDVLEETLRPEFGIFYLDANGTRQWDVGDVVTDSFGIGGRVAVSGRWGAMPGPDKVGVFRTAYGIFYLDTNGSGVWDAGDDRSSSFGRNGVPVAGDWTAGGTDAVGVYRPQNGRWYLDSDNSLDWSAGDTVLGPFGGADDIPVTGRWKP